MASVSDFNRSKSSSRVTLLNHFSEGVIRASGIADEFSNGESSLQKDISALTLSNNVGLKMKKKKKKKKSQGVYRSWGRTHARCSSSGLISRYLRGGGCRVGACEDFDLSFWKKSDVSEDCMLHRLASGVEKIDVECFSYGTVSLFQKKSSRKGKEDVEENVCESVPLFEMSLLPDEVMEMILIRLPLTSLLMARRVCKKWRLLTTTLHFIRMRLQCSYQSPWLFLFGISRDRSYPEMHALDVSLDQWHRISYDVLKNRFMFSVASIGNEIYIVGGCSSSAQLNFPLNDNSCKVHKGVLVFNPLTGLWHKAAPMNSARLQPILGVFHVSADCSIHSANTNRSSNHLKSRSFKISDVYEDPHRYALRCKISDSLDEKTRYSQELNREPSELTRESSKNQLRFALIVVGGHRISRDGLLYHPLDTGEIYDPVTNKWIEIARLPRDFGPVCSGAVCNAKFYVYSENDKLAVYDLEMGLWVTIQISRPPPRIQEYKLNLVSCNNRLFMLCVSWCDTDGLLNRREKAVRKLWEFDLWYHTWSEVSIHPDAPMDRNATFVADADKIYGVEMFKIFGQLLDFLTVCSVSDPEPQWSRLSRKHALPEADGVSFLTKTMLVLQL